MSVVLQDREKDVLTNFLEFAASPRLDLLVHRRVVALRHIRVVMMSDRYGDGAHS